MSSGCVRRVNRLRVHDRIVESKFAERQTNENSFRHLSSQSERLAAVIYGTSQGNQHQMEYQTRPLSPDPIYHTLTSLMSLMGSLSFLRG